MRHRDETLALLRTQIPNSQEVDEILAAAQQVATNWIDPAKAGAADTNGLIYGLVQSGKTGVLTVTGALGADEGYRTVIILTSDNDALYDQTLGRAREAFPGMDIISKADLRDPDAFIQRLRGGTCAIVITKNASILHNLIQNLRRGNVRGLSCLIIDDEADQASLNTRTARPDGSRSAINDLIIEIRRFFEKNTYLQVTATPQALFLQGPGHAFRPKFTVLSHPGADYVGGEDFFGEGSPLVREFDIADLLVISPGSQPTPGRHIPRSLLRALDTFMVAATFKRRNEADQNCAFLCHVSTRTQDHRHIVALLHDYKRELATGARERRPQVVNRLRAAYADLASTHEGLRNTEFDRLIEAIAFYSPGITVKLVNGETDEDVAVRSPYNLFVGGNKLGRGVTIRNLLVSYYGRNPRQPQADTVLQHARMYGYRRRDIGLLRLFLPRQLRVVFEAINKMERSLRELIAEAPNEEFRGVFVESGVSPTRRNVLAPGAVGVYSAGGNYNPAQVARDADVAVRTAEVDGILSAVPDKGHVELPLAEIKRLVSLTAPDESAAQSVWNPTAISGSISELGSVLGHTTGYVYVDRERDLVESRRETQGILSGGEGDAVPSDKLTLFMLRTKERRTARASWWPQVRFPRGRYGFAFAV